MNHEILDPSEHCQSLLSHLLSLSEHVHSFCPLYHFLPHDHVIDPGVLDLEDGEISEIADAGEEGDEGHEDFELVGDLLVHVELHLRPPIGTSS